MAQALPLLLHTHEDVLMRNRAPFFVTICYFSIISSMLLNTFALYTASVFLMDWETIEDRYVFFVIHSYIYSLIQPFKHSSIYSHVQNIFLSVYIRADRLRIIMNN